jgi:hypothetical protein
LSRGSKPKKKKKKKRSTFPKTPEDKYKKRVPEEESKILFIHLDLHSYCSAVMVVGLGREGDSNLTVVRFTATTTRSCGDRDGRDA